MQNNNITTELFLKTIEEKSSKIVEKIIEDKYIREYIQIIIDDVPIYLLNNIYELYCNCRIDGILDKLQQRTLCLLSYIVNNKVDIEYIKYVVGECNNLVRKKNSDYSGIDDPFRNFKLATVVEITIEDGILVRIGDKISRINTLLRKDPEIITESIQDTLMDLYNYTNILQSYTTLNKNL